MRRTGPLRGFLLSPRVLPQANLVSVWIVERSQLPVLLGNIIPNLYALRSELRDCATDVLRLQAQPSVALPAHHRRIGRRNKLKQHVSDVEPGNVVAGVELESEHVAIELY